MDTKVADMRRFVEAKLTEISMWFKPGSTFTFIAHRPGFPEQDFLITSERDLDALIALLERSKLRPEL